MTGPPRRSSKTRASSNSSPAASCSDSRVPANEVTGTSSGDIFVHRNVANQVISTDMNLLAVLSFAVEVLEVKHLIVCGHYGCGGVHSALNGKDDGLIENWLRGVKEVYVKHRSELDALASLEAREERLVALNVVEQVQNLAKTSIVQRAWRNRTLQIHGWVYDFRDGLITDLKVKMEDQSDLDPAFRYDF
ncbi:MAG: carbonic anhydrase [Myxococcaceae bacterium]